MGMVASLCQKIFVPNSLEYGYKYSKFSMVFRNMLRYGESHSNNDYQSIIVETSIVINDFCDVSYLTSLTMHITLTFDTSIFIVKTLIENLKSFFQSLSKTNVI